MKKTILLVLGLTIAFCIAQAQNDSLYIMKAGVVVYKKSLLSVDSIIFYSPIQNIPDTGTSIIATVDIPAGTFTMGSPESEIGHNPFSEIEHEVTLSAFKMSKYEISNTEYAAFLNSKSIGSDGIYAMGAYPTQILIYPSSGTTDFGLHYTGGLWIPVAGYENYPVIFVSWYGATEFATYAGGRLPTEAEWEYACRANTTTPFNTGYCLSHTQASYNWTTQYSNCATNTIPSGSTQPGDAYAANAYGLYNMHGNVYEWCSDWYDVYPTTAQTNPTGPTWSDKRVARSGGWPGTPVYCRSANRSSGLPTVKASDIGCRVVFVLV